MLPALASIGFNINTFLPNIAKKVCKSRQVTGARKCIETCNAFFNSPICFGKNLNKKYILFEEVLLVSGGSAINGGQNFYLLYGNFARYTDLAPLGAVGHRQTNEHFNLKNQIGLLASGVKSEQEIALWILVDINIDCFLLIAVLPEKASERFLLKDFCVSACLNIIGNLSSCLQTSHILVLHTTYYCTLHAITHYTLLHTAYILHRTQGDCIHLHTAH